MLSREAVDKSEQFSLRISEQLANAPVPKANCFDEIVFVEL